MAPIRDRAIEELTPLATPETRGTDTPRPDYSLVGVNASRAIEMGLAEADWHQSPVSRAVMRKLLERRDGPALRDTALWFALIVASGVATWKLWGSWWAIVPYVVYSILYASTSDSRWHEAGHGTAFKTDWMNNALYEIASFMVMRESVIWRWSHTRHHSDTIIVGRDPEIAVPRPTDVLKVISEFFNLSSYPKYFHAIVMHSFGAITPEEKIFVPPSEFPKLFLRARVYVAIYLGVILLSVSLHSVLPLMFVGLTSIFGTWLRVVYGLTQHAGLAENVLDHRLNCRTVYMNPVNRFLYWNMNYHVEHHMYPLVPYHALARLHEAVKDDCPPPYPGLVSAWLEIAPALWRQIKDPAYHIKRQLPPPKPRVSECQFASNAQPNEMDWISVCGAADLGSSDVVRFDHGRKTYAVYRDANDRLYATDGICTHGNTHLAGGLVKDDVIECPKHNGRFHLVDGSPARSPVCRGLATYPVQETEGLVQINIMKPGGAGAREHKAYRFRVVSNNNIATFIKELVLIPDEESATLSFTPGDYLQFDIPAYDTIHFRDFEVQAPFRDVWAAQHVIDMVAHNPFVTKRNNYSLASNWQTEGTLRFNIRIATPPPGQDCAPGVGSSYMFSLKPGDHVTAIGPFGDFHIKPTQREMVYIGGGAGMAPLRAHLSHLLENDKSRRKISFWYGARSRQEIFYEDYFKELEETHPNFTFHLALSSPLSTDEWSGHVGFIHEVLLRQYLEQHRDPRAVEYYLCGPPMMIKACTRMLQSLGIPEARISYDEF